MIDPKRRCRGRRGTIATLDHHFDTLVPHELRHLSAMHWTPVRVAVRAASLLCATKHTRVLDVGAGIGKVCAIGALSGEGTWVGVEHHATLVDSARDLTRALGIANRTRFFQADAFSVDWNEFDALYFYNPFELQLFRDSVAMPPRAVQIARVQARLAALPNCTRVVTLHGFGGVMPPSFELLYHELIPSAGLDLAMWIQRTRRSAGSVAS
jgi:SAM-dependent methyltransferase